MSSDWIAPAPVLPFPEGDAPVRRNKGKKGIPWGTTILITVLALMWLLPLAWTLFTSLRPKEVTDKYGYFSLNGPFNLQNFIDAWVQGGFAKYFVNSIIITVPTVLLVLFFASIMAFAVSRFSWKFNVALLIAFTAGNLLPPQVLAAPLFEIFKHVQLPYWISDSGTLLNTYTSVILANTAFQIGFCTFVLSNFMKAIPHELTEAARVDGAGVWRQYWAIIVPLSRPAFAALGTLEVIFIQSGDRLPVTTAIYNLQGQFLSNYNLLSAAATITLIPTLIIYLVLQRQFVAGLTLGANKG